jgi:multisubunit Na+/H+ antiporter MnhC subunit
LKSNNEVVETIEAFAPLPEALNLTKIVAGKYIF